MLGFAMLTADPCPGAEQVKGPLKRRALVLKMRHARLLETRPGYDVAGNKTHEPKPGEQEAWDEATGILSYQMQDQNLIRGILLKPAGKEVYDNARWATRSGEQAARRDAVAAVDEKPQRCFELIIAIENSMIHEVRKERRGELQ